MFHEQLLSSLVIYAGFVVLLQFNIYVQGDCSFCQGCARKKCLKTACEDICPDECPADGIPMDCLQCICKCCEVYCTPFNNSQGSGDEESPLYSSSESEEDKSYSSTLCFEDSFQGAVTANVTSDKDKGYIDNNNATVAAIASVISIVLIIGIMNGLVCWLYFKRQQRKRDKSNCSSDDTKYCTTNFQTTDKSNNIPTVQNNCPSQMNDELGYTSLHISPDNKTNERSSEDSILASNLKPEFKPTQQDDQQYTYLKKEIVEHQQTENENQDYTYIEDPTAKHNTNEADNVRNEVPVFQMSKNEYTSLQIEGLMADEDSMQHESYVTSEYTGLYDIKIVPTKLDNQDSTSTIKEEHNQTKQPKYEILEPQPIQNQNLDYQSLRREACEPNSNESNLIVKNDQLNHLMGTLVDSNSDYSTLISQRPSSDDDDYKYLHANPEITENRQIQRVPQAYFNQPINQNCDYMSLQKADYAELNDHDREPNENQYDTLNSLARESDDVNSDYNKLITGPVYDEESEEYSHINRSLNTDKALSDTSYGKLQL